MLAAPWALLALIGLPIIFGIYFFRTRSRRLEVSTLFLWVDKSQAKTGGRQIKRVQLPFLIFIELIVISLLAIAAARPMVRLEIVGHPTAIILDTSFSMLAGNDNDTAQKRAINNLHAMLDNEIGFPVQFVLAGAKPQIIAERMSNPAEARAALDAWTCNSHTADLNAAIALTANISTPGTKILVVTDHPPKNKIERDKLLWKSYGKPNDNFGIIHASRVIQDDKDKLLLEIANFSDKPQLLNMTIIETKNANILLRDSRQLQPDEIHRLRTVIKNNTTIDIRLDKDSLAIDNSMTLLPPSQRPVRVKIGSFPADLNSKIQRAIEASGIAEIVQNNPEIIFDSNARLSETDNAAADQNQRRPVWLVHILTEPDEKKVKSFVGPFIIDYASRVVNGLSLDGVVWSCNEGVSIPGNVIISAGNIPLVTDERRRNNSRILHIKLNDRISTLTSNPAWPILVWNILKYRSSQKSGISVNNLKLGTEAEFISGEGDRTLEITTPRNEKRTITINTGLNVHSSTAIRIPADQVGIYKVKSDSSNYEFAVAALSAEESNLKSCKTETSGNWLDNETIRTDYRSVVWIILLAALALLTLHQWLTAVEKTTPIKA
ncbi:MAG: BatA and WFA domain-containing protein [Planctomycetaceae bacterium]|jgi:hypothetical protein|nr:BatA and WFA domain-containing protein [Planctomycetaceae bacterium]